MKKIIIPVLFCLIAHVGFAQKATNMSTVKASPNGTIHYTVMDNAPSIAGCENAATTKERNKCTEEKVKTHIQNNFNKNTAKLIATQGNLQNNKVYVRFIVNKQGGIEKIGARTLNKQMKAEVERVLTSLPSFSKGTHQGSAVQTSFAFWFPADVLLRNAAK